MIEKFFNHPHVLHQTFDDGEIGNATISASIDNSDTLILSQEGRHICIDRGSVPELCKLLKNSRP
jgi:hypothetical protein